MQTPAFAYCTVLLSALHRHWHYCNHYHTDAHAHAHTSCTPTFRLIPAASPLWQQCELQALMLHINRVQSARERERRGDREGGRDRKRGGVLGGMERETKRQSHAHKSRQSVKPGSSAQPARNATAPQWETKSVSAVIDRKWDILPSSSNSWQWRLLCVC